eukprot:jgi/Mesen1/7917/ME000422S07072
MCCSSNAKAVSAGTPSMPSMWWTNALYEGSKVQIWAKNYGLLSPKNNNTRVWSGQLYAWPVKWTALPSADWAITIRRPSATTFQARPPCPPLPSHPLPPSPLLCLLIG